MNISISINVSELVYDIQNKTYLTGRSRENGSNHRQVALMQANNDDENLNQVMRSIANGFATIKAELAEVIIVDDAKADNSLSTDAGARKIEMTMPDNFNTAAVAPMVDAVHQYIVSNAIAEWFQITNKPDADDYNKLAQRSLDHIREALCKRSRPVRVAASI